MDKGKVNKGKKLTRLVSVRNEYKNGGIQDTSLAVLEELVQCGICLERMCEPRMLPCQHTFCLACLKTIISAKLLYLKYGTKLAVNTAVKTYSCPVCKAEFSLKKGLESLDDLSKNFHVETLLKLLEGEQVVTSPQVKAIDYRCVKCQTISEYQEHVCQHCVQIFCSICWIDHLSELDSNLSQLTQQIEESKLRLSHKSQNFSNRCDQLVETIKESIEQKIANIRESEKNVLLEVKAIKEQGNVLHDMITCRVEAVKGKIQDIINDKKQNKNKISNYMNIHRETAKLFEEIYHYGEARIVYDAERIRIDQDKEGIYFDLTEKDQTKGENVENPYENVASMVKHYKSRSFVPRLLWSKCPRPGGVGVAPWDHNKIYVAATDTKNILILDRAKFKLLGRINHPEMLCPINLAFSKKYSEIFVTDKWKHCVHVFSNTGDYMRKFDNLQLKSPDGIAIGQNDEVFVCDTGNNRIVVIDSESGKLLSTIGKGELHIPTSVAIHGEKLIVADVGNNRVKIFNRDGVLLKEIGSFGRNKGEFRSAEVVAVDCLGFILVGDAGNARIQVFQPDGKLVTIFGSKEGFAWISGIHVTSSLDIICTDSRSRSLRIF
ncbi:RING finger protein nhl-1-like isoform X2 [Diorhabda carinulata]|uniref:RING finger protein nhl-1-like isoform X2 n=1 Tax=Diorhabda carinulata TaxID=1163345 RepID=UPI0025A0EF4B|nr:RING finger protein nhl-1-like isoform X2 [Diorhabda carinulata]